MQTMKMASYFSNLLDRLTHRQERDLLQNQVNELSDKLCLTENLLNDTKENLEYSRDRQEQLSIRLAWTEGVVSDTKEELYDTEEDLKYSRDLQQEVTEAAKEADNTLKAYRKLVLPIVLEKLNDLMERNGSTEIYKFLDQFDREGWCLERACYTLIKGSIYNYFYEKDNLGHFENSDGYDLTYWREVMEFGDCDYEVQGMHEILIGHTLNSQQAKYIEYKKELHKRAAIAIINDHLDAIVQTHPDLLTCLEEKSISSSDTERVESIE